MPTTDGRWKPVASNRRASGHQRGRAGAVDASSKLNQPPSAGTSRSIAPGSTTRAPIPSGPSSHFWAGTA